MESSDRRTTEQPKRRACDECRARKLACSKEVDGCARCKREGIKCVYSPQKRMGRPRKHRAVEPAEPEGLAATAAKNGPGQDAPRQDAPKQQPLPPGFADFKFDSTIGMDLDLSFLDVSSDDVNFLDLVDPASQYLPDLPQTATDPGTVSSSSGASQPNHVSPGSFWPVDGGLAQISFDEPLGAPPPPPPQPEITPEEVAQILSADLPDTVPGLSPSSSKSSPSCHGSPAEPDSGPACNCLSALYFALDSLRTLPKNVGEAMRVARTAARVAHDTILCPACGDPPLDLTCKTPITSFQSTMMLGALLPSLSNAYMRILSMVDAEATAADAERRKILFSLSSYGGLWGKVAKADPVKCRASERLEGTELEPILWRLTVRALLKMDVYGVNSLTTGMDPAENIEQPGLKDIINMMEERSRRRHQQLDAMVAAGALVGPLVDHVPLSSATDKPTCLRIIDIAKRSMDDLIIP